MEPLRYRLTSRKFLLAFFTFAAAVAQAFGVDWMSNFDPAEMASVAAILLGWIATEGQLDKQRLQASQQVAYNTLQREASQVVNQLTEELKLAKAEVDRLMADV